MQLVVLQRHIVQVVLVQLVLLRVDSACVQRQVQQHVVRHPQRGHNLFVHVCNAWFELRKVGIDYSHLSVYLLLPRHIRREHGLVYLAILVLELELRASECGNSCYVWVVAVVASHCLQVPSHVHRLGILTNLLQRCAHFLQALFERFYRVIDSLLAVPSAVQRNGGCATHMLNFFSGLASLVHEVEHTHIIFELATEHTGERYASILCSL